MDSSGGGSSSTDRNVCEVGMGKNQYGESVPDEEFIKVWESCNSPIEVARILCIDVRAVYNRRRLIEARQEIQLPSKRQTLEVKYRGKLGRATADLANGTIFVASDCHYHPGEPSLAHQAFVKLVKKHKPDIIVLNGDVFDGAGISRYPKSAYMGNTVPTVKQELEAVADRLNEIEKVAGNAKLIWTLGNHDMRFESRLANLTPEFEGVPGFALKDHFPRWTHTMSFMVNNDIMIKHRYHNGIHATYNNTLKSGISIVTGHLHRLQATIWSDYNGSRFGIDTGTLGDVEGEHMHYGEDAPKNHCSGFAVLTLVDGQLLYPEFCYVQNEMVYFRGKTV